MFFQIREHFWENMNIFFYCEYFFYFVNILKIKTWKKTIRKKEKKRQNLEEK